MISPFSQIDVTRGSVKIGDDVVITAGTRILSHSAVESELNPDRDPRTETVIEDGVFIGVNSVVLPGVRIGKDAIVGAGLGAALTGTRPVVEMNFSDHMVIGLEQIMNQIAKVKYMFGGKATVPLLLRANEGAGFNAAGQHSGTNHTIFAHLPGVKVIAPATPAGAKGLTKTAIRSDDPVISFEHKASYSQTGEVPTNEDFTIPLGEAAVLREGADVTIVATQRMVYEALDVAEELAEELSIEVIDPQSLYPLDTSTIQDSVRKTGRLVVADESPLSYGTHAEIVARVVEESFYSLDAPIKRVGIPDLPIPFAPTLEDEVLPTATEIERAVLDMY
jgi:pyruvate dehydrogenase E1 component beta subunit